MYCILFAMFADLNRVMIANAVHGVCVLESSRLFLFLVLVIYYNNIQCRKLRVVLVSFAVSCIKVPPLVQSWR